MTGFSIVDTRKPEPYIPQAHRDAVEKLALPKVEPEKPSINAQEVLYSLNAIFEENQKLKLENERLNKIVESIREVVCANTGT